MVKYHQIPVLQDNYAYIIEGANRQAVVIDTPDADAILDYCQKNGLNITAICNTHHHNDHIGGNWQIKQATNCKIYGFDAQRIAHLTNLVHEGERLIFGDIILDIMELSGHTIGHIGFYFPQEQWLFCGDTMFSLGCGRLFEGTATQMWHSLIKIRRLAPKTLIFPAHEYTLSNAEFVASLNEQNPEFDQLIQNIIQLRANNLPTIPVKLQSELNTNPFLRADDEKLQRACNFARVGNISDEQQATAFFAHLRQCKNNFQAH